jgi:GNAT superfamily N-acetyltransferase
MMDSAVLEFARLEPAHMPLLSDFSSADADLDDFIKKDALTQQDVWLSATFIVFDDSASGDKPIGYLTLLTDSIRIMENSKLGQFFSRKGIQYHTLPALKIGRLAVRQNLQQKGYGRRMFRFALGKLFSFAQDAGCRFMTVDAKPQSERFYLKLGFEVAEARSGTVKMYLDAYLGKNEQN